MSKYRINFNQNDCWILLNISYIDKEVALQCPNIKALVSTKPKAL